MARKISQKRVTEKICVIDTNVLVRHLHDGDKKLSEVLERYDKVIIPLTVWFETVFVLEKVYKIERDMIEGGLLLVLTNKKIETDKGVLIKVLRNYVENSGLSVVDCYLWAEANENGVELITYDRKLMKKVKV